MVNLNPIYLLTTESTISRKIARKIYSKNHFTLLQTTIKSSEVHLHARNIFKTLHIKSSFTPFRASALQSAFFFQFGFRRKIISINSGLLNPEPRIARFSSTAYAYVTFRRFSFENYCSLFVRKRRKTCYWSRCIFTRGGVGKGKHEVLLLWACGIE